MDSIWMETELPRFPKLEGDRRTDVLVVGGGMAGLLCTYMLRKQGVDCLLLEENRIMDGISGNTTAKITSQHGLIYHRLLERFGFETAGLYLESQQQAVAQFRELCDTMDCDFSEQDSFVYTRGNRKALEDELEALRLLRCPASYISSLPLPMKTAGAIKFPRHGQFHPRKFAAAICRELPIFENTPVRKIITGGAVTDTGTVFANKIIIATHFPILNTHGSYFLKLYQQRSYVLALNNIPKFYGMYRDADENGFSFRFAGSTLLLGGGSHRTGKKGGGWRVLEDFAREYLPGGLISHRWATQDCMSLDAIPYIGLYSKHTPGLYVATGFNKWGMTSSMVAAQLLTDLITERYSPYTGLYAPSRSILRPQLGVNALESAANLLMPSRRRCTHLGCALHWNPREHSWDCACHGSRFDCHGHRIDNPALKDMKQE